MYRKMGLEYHHIEILTEPNPPSVGVMVALIEHNGASIELIEFSQKQIQ
jgi:hypothetical protein